MKELLQYKYILKKHSRWMNQTKERVQRFPFRDPSDLARRYGIVVGAAPHTTYSIIKPKSPRKASGKGIQEDPLRATLGAEKRFERLAATGNHSCGLGM